MEKKETDSSNANRNSASTIESDQSEGFLVFTPKHFEFLFSEPSQAQQDKILHMSHRLTQLYVKLERDIPQFELSDIAPHQSECKLKSASTCVLSNLFGKFYHGNNHSNSQG